MKPGKPFPAGIKSSALIFILAVYFAFFLNVRFWKYVADGVAIGGLGDVVFAVSLPFFLFVPFYIVFSLLVVKKIGKPVVVLLLLFSAGVQYMMLAYDVYVDRFMIQSVLETNTREALDMVTAPFLFWLALTGVLPAVLLALVPVRYEPFGRELRTRCRNVLAALLVLGAFAIVSYKEYAAYGRNNHDVLFIINTYNYVGSVYRYYSVEAKKNREFRIIDERPRWADFEHAEEPKEEDAHTVLVFVLGETTRAANFSLQGYARETNPLLAKQDIVYFKNMVSCGTVTAVSVPCLFSSRTRADFDAADEEFTENILDLAAKAGYDIYWKENDNGCKGVCARVEKMEDTVMTNNPAHCNGSYCYDSVMLDGLRELLPRIKRNTIIVLHLIGSHGPAYFERYPDDFKKFRPTCDTKDIQNCEREAIVNTYDNTVLYTDYILSSAIDILKEYPRLESGLFYVSDHGESLGERGVYLHGWPYRIAPAEQTEVPAVLWLSDTMKKFDYVDWACLKKEVADNVYSHDNVFHSVLGLLEIDSKTYREELDWFVNCRTKPLPDGYR